MQSALSKIAVSRVMVDNEWRRWIAENLILGVHPDGIAQTLMQAGVAQRDVVTEIDLAMRSPYIHGAQRLKIGRASCRERV